MKKEIIFIFSLLLPLILSIPLTSATLITTVKGPTPSGIGTIALIDDSNNTYFPIIGDGIFNLLDETGDIIYSQKCDPDGNIIEEQGENPTTFSCLGEVTYDEEVGLYIDVDSGPADPTELSDPGSYDPETAIWLGVYWPGFAKEAGKGLGMAAVGIVTYPITLLRAYRKYQGYHGNGPIGVPNPSASVPIPSSNIPVIGSIIAAKNSEGLDRAGHISGAVGQAALFGAIGLNAAGKNPTLWGGKSAAPTTTAIVKYDPKFALEQAMRKNGGFFPARDQAFPISPSEALSIKSSSSFVSEFNLTLIQNIIKHMISL